MTNSLVIKLALILLLSILPSLISIFILHRVKQRWQSRLTRVRLMTDYTSRNSSFGDDLFGHFYEYNLDSLGDLSCRYNAHSPYIRCAVNPDGPCQDCIHYQAK
ncbi:hypothetical protein STA3757_14230 [Stanieria sp. NIES-3757]|nr:hypothetical protein STA3757_14230 [Stanieria sp. NIES-3757]